MQQPLQQTMQQPISQDQITAQQMQQQMMLCPVRVVYETQILVPGDQMPSNQTLFINPQNPPPWSQNRQIHNPVIYVHQMPNNLIPAVPQHIDQNQLYLQQYQNYQQMIPQQILTQSQDQRSMQLSNVIPQNMVQNFQNNINTNVQNIPERISHTYTHAANIGPNMQMQIQHRQINPNSIMNSSNDANVHLIQAQQAQAASHRVEIKPGIFMNVAQPQPINQPPIRPPQVLTVNPIQNVSQAATNVQTMQTNVPVGTPRPIQTHSVGSQMSPPTFINPTNGQSVPRVRKVSPATVSRGTAPATVNRGTNMVRGVQTYRPIQPRPQQQHFRGIAPAVQLPNAINMQPQQKAMPVAPPPPVMNPMSTLPSLPIIDPYIPHPNNTKPDENVNQRKRKSESPDEIHKKMAAIQVNITTPIKPVTLPQRNNDASGAVPSTSSLSSGSSNSCLKPEQKTIVDVSMTEPEKNEIELKKITNLVENVQQAIQIDKTNMKQSQEHKEEPNNDKDKLVRNTVYMQARGRMLSDKESSNTEKDSNNVQNCETSPIPETGNVQNIRLEKVEILNNEASTKNTYNNETINKKDMTDVSVTLNTANNKGMLPVNRIIKEERDFVLTHVLDGIVIQESNVAFPIREPAIRRFAQGAAQALKSKNSPQVKADNKNLAESSKDLIKESENTSQQNNETTMKTDEVTNDSDNPFVRLGHADVKSWTIEQLSSHLSKYEWNETATLLIEHEIDGESLFLVSKTQLLTIGIKEDHAELICNFVKS